MKINRSLKASIASVAFQLAIGGISDLEALRLILDRILMQVEDEIDKERGN